MLKKSLRVDADGEEDYEVTPFSASTTTFSQLLSADDDVVSLDMMDRSFYFNAIASTENHPPKMLCFGSYKNEEEDDMVITTTFNGATNKTNTPQKSKYTKPKVTCSTTTDSTSGNRGSTLTTSKSSRKRTGYGQEPVPGTTTPAVTQRSNKKSKTGSPATTGFKKARREKLGERIATLQYLVSPFGKTDTASVLHEAMGYIRFLHDQVQVLCAPYLRYPSPPDGGESGEEKSTEDLRSKGLCLIPVAHTVHLASRNGADIWSSPVDRK